MGSHLAESLVKLGARVFILDILMLPKSYFESQNLKHKTTVFMSDLRDIDALRKIIKENKITHIFHLGAQALVPLAFEDPRATFETNIMGTVNVLEAARELGSVEAVLVASSDKAYGKDCQNALETQKVFGDHPYDASKAATDMVAQTYFKTYGLPVVIARFGNIFGPGDLYFSRLVPGIMQAIVQKQTLQIRSDGQFRRDYLYVKDVAEGYVKMAENIQQIKGEAFNFSTNWNYSVIELIEKIGEISGAPCRYKILNIQKNEIPAQSLNSQKAKKVLSWQPKFAFQQAVKETFEWYQNYFNQT